MYILFLIFFFNVNLLSSHPFTFFDLGVLLFSSSFCSFSAQETYKINSVLDGVFQSCIKPMALHLNHEVSWYCHVCNHFCAAEDIT